MNGRLDEANLSAKEHALLRLCEQVTTAAYRVTDQQTGELRELGWSDPEIAEAVLVAAMFAMFNRVADAFGLPDPNYFADPQAAVKPATSFEADLDQPPG